MRKEHITAPMLYCFYKDPYVYNQTYNLQNLEVPVRAQDANEEIIKRLLFGPADSSEESYATDAPVNPTTQKPYGEGTQKYEDWAEAQRAAGRTPMHPAKLEGAREVCRHVTVQAKEEFVHGLRLVLGDPDRRAGVTAEAQLDKLPVRGTLDLVSGQGGVIMLHTTHSIPAFLTEDGMREKLAFMATFNWMVVNEQEQFERRAEELQLAVLLVEYQSPYRVSLCLVDLAQWLPIVTASLKQLASFLANSKDVRWRSRLHDICIRL